MSTYIVAEIGSNHDGLLSQAIHTIGQAVVAGASAVKFQCLPNLPHRWMHTLKACAKDKGLDFFATPFDLEAVGYLAQLGVPYIKIASIEMVDRELFDAAYDTGIPLIVSTGMATWEEISDVALLGVTLLQCTVRYPTPPSEVNLRAMVQMQKNFGARVGLSDHTTSTTIPAAAVALGATVIEKHFTLEPHCCKDWTGSDHAFALQPAEFRAMVDGIREVEQALGDGEKGPREGDPLEARGRRLQWQT